MSAFDTEKQIILDKIDALICDYVRIDREQRGKNKSQRVEISMPVYDEKEAQAATHTILSNWISQGPKVREFEGLFAQYIGVKHAVAVNSGSSANLVALSAALEAGELHPGDEIIVPASTFPTVASPIIQVGCIPVYVDMDPTTYNINPQAIEAALSPKTTWLMPVHTVGYPADMSQIMAIANRHGLRVIEDCCEAHGSSIHGKKVGSFGTVTTFSFFVAHNMTTGEGGMVLTNSDRYAEMCRSLREFGRVDQTNVRENRFYSDEILKDYDKRYIFERLGFNLRMTDVAASFGVEQLKKLDALNEQRRKNAAYLTAYLKKFEKFLQLPTMSPGFIHTYYTYPLMVRPESGISRIDLVKFLEQRGIETRAMFAGCLPDQPAFRHSLSRIAGSLKNARIIRDFAFFIGVHPGLDQNDLERIGESFDAFFQKYQ